MGFITLLRGGDGNSLLTAILALTIIFLLAVVVVAGLIQLINWVRGGPTVVGWQSSAPYELPLSAAGQQALRIRDVEIRNIRYKRVSGLIISFNSKPEFIYSNAGLEEITGVGNGSDYLLKSPYLDRGKPLVLRIAGVMAEPAEVSKVVADSVNGKQMDLSKERFNWGIVILVLACVALAFLLGAISNPFLLSYV